MKPQWENPDPQPTGDDMTDKNEERIEEIEDRLDKMEEELATALDSLGKIETLIAYWNAHFPDDPMPGSRRVRPESHYTMTDEEWKKRTRIPHPRDGPKKFNPITGVWE